MQELTKQQLKIVRQFLKVKSRYDAVKDQYDALRAQVLEVIQNKVTVDGKTIVVFSRETRHLSDAVNNAVNLLATALKESNWQLVSAALHLLQNPPTSISKCISVR